jgi:RNA polymerase sigma factor (sigma-70 family)
MTHISERTLSDGALLRQYLATRDEPAFTALVQRHGAMVRSVARRIAAEDADDVTQAVFLLLAQRARHLGNRQSLAGWLHETARLCAANARRSRLREHAKVQSAQLQSAQRASTEPSMSSADIDLDATLARLSAADRELLLLRYVEGLTLEETSAQLALPAATLAKRAERALGKLRDFLRPHSIPPASLAIPSLTRAEAAHLSHATLGNAASSAARSLAATTKLGTLPLAAKALAATVLLVAATATAVAFGRVHSTVPVTPPSVASTRALATVGDAAKATAESFLTALRNRDEPALAALSPGTTDAERARHAAEYLANFRLALYDKFPERLALGRDSRVEIDARQNPLAASYGTLPPIEAAVGYLNIALLPGAPGSGHIWRISDVTFNESDSAYSGPQLGAAPGATPNVPASPIATLMARMQSFKTIAPESATDADLPKLLAAYKQDLADVTQVLAILPAQPPSVERADLTVLQSALKTLVDAIEQGGLAGLRAADEKLKSSPELKAMAGRYTAAADAARKAADANEEFTRATSRPLSAGADVTLTLASSGQTVHLPGPVKLPEWLTTTTQYKEWLTKTRDFRLFRTRDDAGNLYEASAQGVSINAEGFPVPLIPFIRRYRPDGTLAASAMYTEGLPAEWSEMDATGKRLLFKIEMRSVGNPPQHVPHRIRLFLPDGAIRTWETRGDGKTVWYDYLENAIGQGRKSIHLVHDNGKDDGGPILDPGLAGLPIR